jgi:hypothetical protein
MDAYQGGQGGEPVVESRGDVVPLDVVRVVELLAIAFAPFAGAVPTELGYGGHQDRASPISYPFRTASAFDVPVTTGSRSSSPWVTGARRAVPLTCTGRNFIQIARPLIDGADLFVRLPACRARPAGAWTSMGRPTAIGPSACTQKQLRATWSNTTGPTSVLLWAGLSGSPTSECRHSCPRPAPRVLVEMTWRLRWVSVICGAGARRAEDVHRRPQVGHRRCDVLRRLRRLATGQPHLRGARADRVRAPRHPRVVAP